MDKSKSKKPYWIKERDNPQLGIYYVACGQMSPSEAARNLKPLYGSNNMLRFDTLDDYQKKLVELGISDERSIT